MYRSAVVFGFYLSFAIAVGGACASNQPQTPGDDSFTASGGTGGGSGGSSGTGTSGGTTGGSVASGGTGGSTTGGTGGSTGGTTGGSSMMGGAGKGASGGTGGSTGGTGGSTGGSTTGGTGGSTGGTGGSTGGTGGSTGGTTGGGAGTGSGTGGASTVSCDTTFKVGNDGFVRMPSKGGGCYSGYAFAGGDSTSTVMFPGGGKDFSMSMGMLNIKGTVGSATEANMYAGNVYFGFNIGQAAGASTKTTVKPAGTGLTVTCSGCAMPPMRVQIVGSKSYCADLTSGTSIPYSSFKFECWTGGSMTAYDMSPIESIQISIPGGAADATFDMTLMSVTET